MDKKEYYIRMHNNIKILRTKEINIEGDYVCPLCLKSYREQDVIKLTEEDVPQRSLGGRRIALTCKECNNVCGSEIDVHLFNLIKVKEQKFFLPGDKRKIYVQNGEKKLNATIEIGENRDIKLLVDITKNNPKIWNFFYEQVLIPQKEITIEDKNIKKDERRINAALLKNAYLLLFAKTGYTFLLDKYYSCLREQIFNPNIFYIPNGLWTMQDLSIPDGIYLTKDNRYRGFFVVYTLQLKLLYRVCVLIPTPNVPYLLAVKELEKINSQTKIRVVRLPERDYFNDINSIMNLRSWCYGWNMEL